VCCTPPKKHPPALALAAPDRCASPFHADEAAQERMKTLRNYDMVKGERERFVGCFHTGNTHAHFAQNLRFLTQLTQYSNYTLRLIESRCQSEGKKKPDAASVLGRISVSLRMSVSLEILVATGRAEATNTRSKVSITALSRGRTSRTTTNDFDIDRLAKCVSRRTLDNLAPARDAESYQCSTCQEHSREVCHSHNL